MVPVDGPTGAIWRTVAFPLRALAPVALQLRRATRGDYWVESVEEHRSPGPIVELEDDGAVQSPDDGFGPLHRRGYQVRIVEPAMSAEQLLDAFRRDPNRFSPTSFAVFVPDPSPRGLLEGTEVEVKLPGPWDGPVRVTEATASLVRFETLDGHMEAGRIEFTAEDVDGGIRFSIDSLAKSGDAAFDWLYRSARIGKQFQSEMWAQVLEAAVRVSGGHQEGRLHFTTTTFGRGRR